MVTNSIRTTCTNWTDKNRHSTRNYCRSCGIIGIGQISQLVDSDLMIISSDEDYMINVMVGDKLENLVPLSPVTTDPRFTTITPYLINGRRDGHNFPGYSSFLRLQKGLLKPFQLSGT